ncbi:hypothetical protein QE327_gp023 [Pseudomonas phage Henu5]|uniref:Uncharacterized protein n=1 Tax=Pseudomonas phage Henu5 TaxID=2499902 RepID=A0A410T7Y9_9CAUD|nr:hypothetical protein QE327_gp023 [Pseudomonas phage Henu5]QAU05056.1 hypothetical protein Henu5_gp25 [Pseudomonas phage Henu5]
MDLTMLVLCPLNAFKQVIGGLLAQGQNVPTFVIKHNIPRFINSLFHYTTSSKVGTKIRCCPLNTGLSGSTSLYSQMLMMRLSAVTQVNSQYLAPPHAIATSIACVAESNGSLVCISRFLKYSFIKTPPVLFRG